MRYLETGHCTVVFRDVSSFPELTNPSAGTDLMGATALYTRQVRSFLVSDLARGAVILFGYRGRTIETAPGEIL